MRLYLLHQSRPVGNDPVEGQNRQIGRKTRDRRRHSAERVPQRVQRRTVAEAPFVEVAHQNSRVFITLFKQPQKSLCLPGT